MLKRCVGALLTALLLLPSLSGCGGQVRSATVQNDTVEFSLSAQGILVRDETLLTEAKGYFQVLAEDGAPVEAGAVLALAYEDAETLEQAQRMTALRQEMEETAAAMLPGTGDAAAAARELAADVARHNTARLRGDALRLRSRLLFDGYASLSAELEALRAEYEALESANISPARELTAGGSGRFVAATDGLETWNATAFEALTVSSLQSFLKRSAAPDSGSYGKLVTGNRFTLALLVEDTAADSLRAGAVVRPDLSQYRAGKPECTVQYISAPENGLRAVVLAGESDEPALLTLRWVRCPLVLSAVSGLRVPAEAIFTRADGSSCVYLEADGKAISSNVCPFCVTESFALCEGELLHPGSTVLYGSGLYDGKRVG